MTLKLKSNEITLLFEQGIDERRKGGWQGLIGALQDATNPESGTAVLTDELLARIRQYAFNYGQGGFEDRLVAIFGRTLGPNLDGQG